MKKQYTNAEKIAYFEAQLAAATEYYKERKEFLERKIATLKQLNGNDYTSQNWNSDLQAELEKLRAEASLRGRVEKDESKI